MTISSSSNKVGPFNGNGVTTAFPFTFKVFDQADLDVILTSSDGDDTTLTLTTHYTVSLNGDQNTNPGGTVTLLTAPASGETLTVVRWVDTLQETDITNGGGFYPEVIENALDRLTMLSQQLEEKVNRSLSVSVSTPAGVATDLPTPAASKVIGWNADADALVNVDVSDLATVVASAYTVVDKFTGNGSQVLFTLTNVLASSNMADVSVDGVVKNPGVDYTVSGNKITFAVAPTNGQVVIARYIVAASQVPGSSHTVERHVATASQTAFTLASTYTPGANTLTVYVNGLLMSSVLDYAETSTNVVTFTSGLSEDDEVVFVVWAQSVISVADAVNVSYTPGGTGAVVTNVQTKLREFVSVKDFGAVGDGVTDDTAAIQAAITHCVTNAKVLLITKGTYRITANLTHPDLSTGRFLHIEGEGRETKLLGESPATAIFDFGKTSDNRCEYATIKNLQLAASTARGVTYGILAPYFNHNNLQDLWLAQFSEAAIRFGDTLEGYSNTFNNVLTWFSKAGIYASGAVNENSYYHCKFWLCDIGFVQDGGFGNILSNCLFESNAKAGAAVRPYGGLTFDACYFEGNAAISNPAFFPGGTTAGITTTTPATTILSDIYIDGGSTGFPLTTTMAVFSPSPNVTVSGCFTQPSGDEAAGNCFVYAQAVDGLVVSNCRATTNQVPVVKTYGTLAYGKVSNLSAFDNTNFSRSFYFDAYAAGMQHLNIDLPTISIKTSNPANYANTDTLRWGSAGVDATAGSILRADMLDPYGRRNVASLALATTGYTGIWGFTLAATDYPQNIGKLFSFALWTKVDNAGTLFYLWTNANPTGAVTQSTTDWTLQRGYFIWPNSGTIRLGIGKNNNVGRLSFTPPVLSEVGANYADAYAPFVQQYQFRGSAAPTTGTWFQGDIVWNTGVAAAGVPGWVCTTAGTPGTWKAMAAVAA